MMKTVDKDEVNWNQLVKVEQNYQVLSIIIYRIIERMISNEESITF